MHYMNYCTSCKFITSTIAEVMKALSRKRTSLFLNFMSKSQDSPTDLGSSETDIKKARSNTFIGVIS